ncbi:hypothetical protein J7F03_38615 [Streptomyces sp. ISL-43]|uniref:hypothetical protein n=1 Tax=Streptomyces sp. ISL-43 TaxID=2819183 RepID=UPI001BE8B817|nr:hypothetical protein [Streptomyces sp. ISL-43]MBT2452847.1 hypothetical protein [Streptomyces sp. ISL-43]
MTTPPYPTQPPYCPPQPAPTPAKDKPLYAGVAAALAIAAIAVFLDWVTVRFLGMEMSVSAMDMEDGTGPLCLFLLAGAAALTATAYTTKNPATERPNLIGSFVVSLGCTVLTLGYFASYRDMAAEHMKETAADNEYFDADALANLGSLAEGAYLFLIGCIAAAVILGILIEKNRKAFPATQGHIN